MRLSWSFIAAVFFVAPLAAQQNLPKSTQELLAASARVEALSLGDFKTLLSQAQSGDREAQYLMGLIYERGLLVPRDFSATRSWILKSAEQGHVPSQGAMGQMYLMGVRDNGPIPDYADADRWLRLAATQGDADAQFWLGTGYERGWFGGTDYREALKWLRKAAAQGLPNAQYCLGQMYEEGKGVPESDFMAASWYRKAADHFPHSGHVGGIWEAEVQLANLYRHGRLPKDDIEAYMWFAIVGSSVVPADGSDMRLAAQHMTKSQIAKAQRMADDWIKCHTAKPVDVSRVRIPPGMRALTIPIDEDISVAPGDQVDVLVVGKGQEVNTVLNHVEVSAVDQGTSTVTFLVYPEDARNVQKTVISGRDSKFRLRPQNRAN